MPHCEKKRVELREAGQLAPDDKGWVLLIMDGYMPHFPADVLVDMETHHAIKVMAR